MDVDDIDIVILHLMLRDWMCVGFSVCGLRIDPDTKQ